MADRILKLARPRNVASVSNRYRIQVLDPQTSKYHLGIKLFMLGNQAVLQFDLTDSCRAHRIRLMDKPGRPFTAPCVGAPIYDHTMSMAGAISVAALSARLTTEKLPAFGRMVLEAAEKISKALGYEKQKRANAR